jgi:hypothetical protein
MAAAAAADRRRARPPRPGVGAGRSRSSWHVDDVDRAIRLVLAPAAGVQAATGIDVRVVAVGTGQALDIARRGDADVVFVHDRAAEEKFVAKASASSAGP